MKTDTQIQHDVLAELEWDPSVEASSIGVASNDDGVVTLTGHVASFREKDRAEEIARRVYGVRAIANGIEVKLVGDNRRTDADIASILANGTPGGVMRAFPMRPEQAADLIAYLRTFQPLPPAG